ncbi:hypothetical protein RFI_38985 [Reticulomyxa filosa]|uniref:Uncharacterized protein n=1 Tax=Reticulomyxa filosa TaxID=46433 RepID=X6LCP6_RETFI|nr:hypothetical protein RFI_38985 [Reticulomyxa filosa]|eukprot:ETN98509.1 hypothetical protein RFI_38985 [Reticulomyxa filosa]
MYMCDLIGNGEFSPPGLKFLPQNGNDWGENGDGSFANSGLLTGRSPSKPKPKKSGEDVNDDCKVKKESRLYIDRGESSVHCIQQADIQLAKELGQVANQNIELHELFSYIPSQSPEKFVEELFANTTNVRCKKNKYYCTNYFTPFLRHLFEVSIKHVFFKKKTIYQSDIRYYLTYLRLLSHLVANGYFGKFVPKLLLFFSFLKKLRGGITFFKKKKQPDRSNIPIKKKKKKEGIAKSGSQTIPIVFDSCFNEKRKNEFVLALKRYVNEACDETEQRVSEPITREDFVRLCTVLHFFFIFFICTYFFFFGIRNKIYDTRD